jgi:hypothetical protein
MSKKNGAMYRAASAFPKATWRNGSAFGFDRQRHQKVAGSSPAVVIFFLLIAVVILTSWMHTVPHFRIRVL